MFEFVCNETWPNYSCGIVWFSSDLIADLYVSDQVADMDRSHHI